MKNNKFSKTVFYEIKIMSNTVFFLLFVCFLMIFSSCSFKSAPEDSRNKETFKKAAQNGKLANEAFMRSQRLMSSWLTFTDARTGLLPVRLYDSDSQDIWNAKDSAADNYPFLVLTSYFTNQELFNGRMQEILFTETALTSRIDRLPDTYSFSKGDFNNEKPDLDRIIFGASEYIKDGLITIVELLGQTPWHARMIGIMDDIWEHASVKTPSGFIPSTNYEVNGELLQVLSRIYWMTQNEEYLEYAIRLGDYYLLEDHHPTRDFDRLRLRDHGGEIVAGLTELYATVHYARPEKARIYQDPLYEMLDRILEVGRNDDGLFYNVINPQTGEVLNDGLTDTFGYILNAYYTIYQLDNVESYHNATLAGLNAISGYGDYDWENGSADGDADVIEGVLYLYNREPVSSTAKWMDRQIQTMWSKQDSAWTHDPEGQWRESGIIEGWHGDGNFARTSMMYAMWKTKGTSIQPWRKDVVYGAIQKEDELFINLSADENWSGKLIFDRPRHRYYLNLPLDWPRINQFAEWFTVEKDKDYILVNLLTNEQTSHKGNELLDGVTVSLESGEEQRFILRSVE
ncbi:hypothetical protein SAMN05443144_11762 [Fodinibius roseus]|uniref:Uncharacterized protein n=2 Tax=Fodinibius roseus TaxID=1194090 RepID=A0A1M5GI62_9BACT|nr:hypothetical protein SAMN05443144_11762 [Fodinibius roseus]